MTTLQTDAKLDFVAATLSTACLIHCLALPILVAILPLSMTWLENEWVHRLLVLIALPVSGVAIANSLRREEGLAFPLAAVGGLALLIVAAFIEALHDYEVSVTVAGSLLLAAAHIGRWSTRHRQMICDDNEEQS